jgi:hypothetical protein
MIANALPRPLTAGSVDNAILRADGTGGATLENSGLIVDDAVVPYSVTGDAATDVITATGHIYTANQTVIFSAITGGAGLSANTVYFVRNPSGNTFQLSTTSGGAAINFTTNITAGTVIAIQANVAISQNTAETNSALVLTPKGTGAFIVGLKPDGTNTGGNARGTNAVDLQTTRSVATQVASGTRSFVGGGERNTASNTNNVVSGGYQNTASGGFSNIIPSAVCGGGQNTANSMGSFVGGGRSNAASNDYSIVGSGYSNNASGNASVVCGGGIGGGDIGAGNIASGTWSAILGGSAALANRTGMQAHAVGQFAAQGDAQRARFVLRNKTTTNSAVELFLDGSATRLTIPSGKVLALTINISGISSTGAAVAHYMRQYALKNVSGTCTEVYAPITIGTDNAAGTSIALSAGDDANGEYLKVSVTGTASTIWRWVASVDAVEIIFGT